MHLLTPYSALRATFSSEEKARATEKNKHKKTIFKNGYYIIYEIKNPKRGFEIKAKKTGVIVCLVLAAIFAAAAAKTAVSVIGGAVSALLFGFGVYKVYGSKDMKEFVVAEDGLYVGNFTRNKFNPDNMEFISKNEIPDSEIVAENKKVTMTNLATGEYFLFDLSSHSTLTAEELKTRLEKMLSSRQTVREAAPAEGNTVPDGGEEPFAD